MGLVKVEFLEKIGIKKKIEGVTRTRFDPWLMDDVLKGSKSYLESFSG